MQRFFTVLGSKISHINDYVGVILPTDKIYQRYSALIFALCCVPICRAQLSQFLPHSLQLHSCHFSRGECSRSSLGIEEVKNNKITEDQRDCSCGISVSVLAGSLLPRARI